MTTTRGKQPPKGSNQASGTKRKHAPEPNRPLARPSKRSKGNGRAEADASRGPAGAAPLYSMTTRSKTRAAENSKSNAPAQSAATPIPQSNDEISPVSTTDSQGSRQRSPGTQRRRENLILESTFDFMLGKPRVRVVRVLRNVSDPPQQMTLDVEVDTHTPSASLSEPHVPSVQVPTGSAPTGTGRAGVVAGTTARGENSEGSLDESSGNSTAQPVRVFGSLDSEAGISCLKKRKRVVFEDETADAEQQPLKRQRQQQQEQLATVPSSSDKTGNATDENSVQPVVLDSVSIPQALPQQEVVQALASASVVLGQSTRSVRPSRFSQRLREKRSGGPSYN
ncbi:hypothetical protein ABW20_dc0107129 [Dactylellina cionopaga]|nr:hypothetical protein ABW20_dc0107129 [Dactylellina cionopaga]